MNAKKDFLNSDISSKIPLSEPNKKCVFNSMPILQSLMAAIVKFSINVRYFTK
jgi:hypothetical protein